MDDQEFEAHVKSRLERLARPAAPLGYVIAKRGIDIVFSVIALALLGPIMMILALLIKVTTRGPAFLTQKRGGLGGKFFTIYKLRSMRTTAPRYGVHPMSDDYSRVTPIGRWLRKLSLD